MGGIILISKTMLKLISPFILFIWGIHSQASEIQAESTTRPAALHHKDGYILNLGGKKVIISYSYDQLYLKLLRDEWYQFLIDNQKNSIHIKGFIAKKNNTLKIYLLITEFSLEHDNGDKKAYWIHHAYASRILNSELNNLNFDFKIVRKFPKIITGKTNSKSIHALIELNLLILENNKSNSILSNLPEQISAIYEVKKYKNKVYILADLKDYNDKVIICLILSKNNKSINQWFVFMDFKNFPNKKLVNLIHTFDTDGDGNLWVGSNVFDGIYSYNQKKDSWNIIKTPDRIVSSIFFNNTDYGYIIGGSDRYIYKTVDAGKTWKRIKYKDFKFIKSNSLSIDNKINLMDFIYLETIKRIADEWGRPRKYTK